MADFTSALDLDLFDNAKNGYAPEPIKKNRKQSLELLNDRPVTSKRAIYDAKTSRMAAIRACAFALTTLIVIGSLIYFRVVLTELQSELKAAQSELSVSESEYTSLQMKYNKLLSPDKVEEYARDELGMVKKENYQIRYFDLSGSDGAQLTK